MIISDKKQFIFIHNPKTAGMSVRQAFSEYDDRNLGYWNHKYITELDRIIDKAHIPISDFIIFDDYHLLEKYFVFGFVRNPYDRFYSAYEYHKKTNGIDIDINEFSTRLNSINIRYDFNLIHFCPQHYFFYLGNKYKADFIGRFENINEDYMLISSILGLDHSITMTNVHKEITGDYYKYRAIFDGRMIDFINNLYEKDFSLFHYQKIVKKSYFIKRELKYNLTYKQEIIKRAYIPYDQIDIAVKKINKLEDELNQKKYELSVSNNKLNLIYDSMAWKIAKPLRWIYNLYKSKF